MTVSDVNARRELLALAAEVGGSLAFLQQGEPSLAAELTRLTDLGHRSIGLVGVDTGPLGPAQSWLRRVAAHWWRQQPDPRPDVRLGTRLMTEPDATEFWAALVGARPVTGTESGLTSEAWEHVTSHRHQVMVCRGPRCTAKGAEEGLRGLVLGMLEAGLGDDDVLLVHTGCQFPCNQSPVVSVQPDDVWYGHVDASVAHRIVGEHLVDGNPVEDHRLPRVRRVP
ncbi:MAG: (2Fe-2S) ferredoxin domain-containing protein [Marmoricola sp.]|nr:(2Fe-2S) ferredoxin domain-containing protein [Marmoricola sp.]